MVGEEEEGIGAWLSAMVEELKSIREGLAQTDLKGRPISQPEFYPHDSSIRMIRRHGDRPDLDGWYRTRVMRIAGVKGSSRRMVVGYADQNERMTESGEPIIWHEYQLSRNRGGVICYHFRGQMFVTLGSLARKMLDPLLEDGSAELP